MAKTSEVTLGPQSLTTLGDDALRKHEHLTPLVSGSASTPCWSPCGEWIAFLSDRDDGNDDKNKAKTAVWLLPASRPGEANGSCAVM